jgi:hypothetical protein
MRWAGTQRTPRRVIVKRRRNWVSGALFYGIGCVVGFSLRNVARQVSGLFETRWVFVERSCNGGADSKRAGPQDSGQLFEHALIEF